MRTKHTLVLPQILAAELSNYAEAKGLSEETVIEAALSSYLFSDDPNRLEVAFERRLDQFARQLRWLQRSATISSEAIALFIRFWLTHTPPLPDTALPAAQAKGHERFQNFIATLGNRLACNSVFEDEVIRNVNSSMSKSTPTDKTTS
jgi:hypothetical protein